MNNPKFILLLSKAAPETPPEEAKLIATESLLDITTESGIPLVTED